jgi:tail tube protein gp19
LQPSDGIAVPNLPNVAGVTRFALELAGTAAGLPESAQGGDARGDVVVSAGPDGVQRKHLGDVHYTDIVLTCGSGMEPVFWTWLADTLEGGKDPLRDGVLRVLDFDRKERERLEFTHALLTEISFPALDGSSKDAFQLTVRIAAEQVRRVRGDGAAAVGNVKAKQALASNFEVTLTGLDLKRVARVGPLTIRRRPAEETNGGLHVDPTAGPLEVPDLELTLAEAGSESVVDWHRKFVIDGNNSDADEKSGSISLLEPAGKKTLLQLTLAGVGIFALEREAAAGGRDALPRVIARMYCEAIRLVPDAR